MKTAILNTTENNRLIAEFIGNKQDEDYYILPYVGGTSIGMRIDEMTFHSSFDWLMPVAAKCVNMADSKMFDEWSAALQEAAGTFNIKFLYNEVVEFIKWYNDNKKEFK